MPTSLNLVLLMNTTTENNLKKSKVIEWDGQSVSTLADLLRKPEFENKSKMVLSIVKSLYPVPRKISREFPNIIAIDAVGQCLISLAGMTIKSLAELRFKRKVEAQVAEQLEMNYFVDTKTDIAGLPMYVGYLIKEERFCYCDQFSANAYLYYSALPDYKGLPTDDIEVSWTVLAADEAPEYGTSPSLAAAVLDSHLTSAEKF